MPVPIDSEVRRKLQALHPPAGSASGPAGEHSDVPEGLYDEVDGDLVRKVVGQLKGAPGPSGLTTDILRDMCRADSPGARKLCEAIARLTKRVASSELLQGALGPLMVGRLVALDKGNDEGRPIGIGEALRRLGCKLICRAAEGELQRTCGAMQLCAGMPSGCEAGAEALQQLWENPEVEPVLLIDAPNAFNKMNRAEALNSAWARCPILGRPLQNMYGVTSTLRLEDGSAIDSEEGTTQGCPLGMAMFAVSSLPMIARVAVRGVTQIWYADDTAGGGRVALAQLKDWFDALVREAPPMDTR